MKLAQRPRNRPKVTDGAMTSISDQVGIFGPGRRSPSPAPCRGSRHGTTCRRARARRSPAGSRRSGEIVEQHVADAPAEDDADGAPDDEIVDVGGLHRRPGRPPDRLVADQRLGVPPAEEDADDIGQRIPADGERPDLDQHRVDGGKGMANSVILASRPSAPSATAPPLSHRPAGAARRLQRRGRASP